MPEKKPWEIASEEVTEKKPWEVASEDETLKKKEPTTVESETSLLEAKGKPTALTSPYSGAFGQQSVSPQKQMPQSPSKVTSPITEKPLGTDIDFAGPQTSQTYTSSEVTQGKSNELYKDAKSLEKTSIEKDKEKQNVIDASGLGIYKGQAPKSDLPVSEKPAPLDFQSTIITEGKTNADAYAGILDKYINDIKETYPERYTEIMNQNAAGLSNNQKFGILTNAFNHEYKKIGNDIEILNARGDDKVFATYQKYAEDLNKAYNKYDLEAYVNKQNALNQLVQQYNIKEQNGALTPVEDADLKAQYQKLKQELDAIIPESEKDKYFSELQIANTNYNDYKNTNQGVIEQYSSTLDSYNKLVEAQKKSIEDFPEVKEQFAKIKAENEAVKNSHILSTTTIGNTLEELWNVVYDSAAGVMTFAKDLAKKQMLPNQQAAMDVYAGKLSEFTEDWMRATTSDLPIFKDGKLENPGRLIPVIAKTAGDMATLLYGANKFTALSKSLGATKAANNIGLITSSIIQTYDDYKNEALANGWTDEDAMKFGLQSAFLTSALETISPNAVLRGSKIEQQSLKDAIKTMSAGKGTDTFFKSMFKDVPSELAQEFSQMFGDKLSNYIANGLTQAPEKLETDVNVDEVLETGLLTTAVTMLAGGTVGRMNEKKEKTYAVIEAAKNFPKFQELLKQQLDNGQITQEKYDEIFKTVSQGVMALNKMPQDLSEKKKVDILPLLSEKIELEQKVKELDSAFKPIYEKNLNVIDKQIQDILNIKENVSKDKQGLPSEEPIGKEPEQTELKPQESEAPVEASGVLQTPEVTPKIEQPKVVTKQPIIEPEKPSLPELSEEEKKQGVVYKSENKKAVIRKHPDGYLEVVDKDGKPFKKDTRKKYLKEYLQKINFTEGKKALDNVPDAQPSQKEWPSFVAENSENPEEILNAYTDLQETYRDVEGSHKEEMIASWIGKIKREGFLRFGDRNNISMSLAKTYFAKKGEGLHIDDMAIEISELAGVEVTPQDIVDFMVAYPNGPSQFKASKKNPELQKLSDKFEAITGSKISDDIVDAYKKQIQDFHVKEQELINKYEYETYAEAEQGYYDAISRGEIEIDEEGNITGTKGAGLPSGETEVVEGEPKQEVKEPEPPKEEPPKKEEPEGEEKKRKYKIGERVVLSENLPDDVKEGMKKKGIHYVPVSMDVTTQEAKDIVAAYESMEGGMEALEKHITNLSNGIKPSVRTALLQQYVAKLVNNRVKSTDISEQEMLSDKITDIMQFAQQFATEGGRAVNMNKMWQHILGKLPEQAVFDIKKRIGKRNSTIDPDFDKNANKVKAIIDEYINSEEFRQRVEEEIEAEFKKYAEDIYEKDAIDKIDDALAKLEKALSGRAYEATLGIPIAIAQGAVKVLRRAIRVGKSINEAIKMAIDYVKANHKGEFDEKKFTEIIEQFTKDLKLKKKKGKKELTEEEVKEKVNGIREKVLKRKIKETGEFLENPELYEKKLEEKLNKAKAEKSDDVKKLEEELKEKRELLKAQRKLKEVEGLPEEKVNEVIQDGLTMAIEKGYISDANFRNKYAAILGLEHLTDADIKFINEMANVAVEYEKSVAEFENDPSEENIKKLNKALYAAQKANKALSQYYRDKKSFWGFRRAAIQGNLLTTASIVANVGYNVLNSLPNMAVKAIASSMDWIRVKLAEATRLEKYFGSTERRQDFFAHYKDFWKLEGFRAGGIEGLKEMRSGTVGASISEKDKNAIIEPAKAWATILGQLKGKEKRDFAKLLGALDEGAFMFFPEMSFRLLNLGDKPFRRAAEYRSRREYITIRLNKLRRELEAKKDRTTEEDQLLADIQSGKEYTKQFYNPDEKTLMLTEEEGKTETFQQKSIVASAIDAISGKFKNEDDGKIAKFSKGFFKLLGATQAPYINTPTNIIVDMMKFANPLVAISTAGYKANKGDIKGAQSDIAKAIVGQMIIQGALYLIENGIIGADDSEEKQERNMEYTMGEPRMINWSHWNRILDGDFNSKWKDGDRKTDYTKLGIIGALLFTYANMYKGKSRDEIKENVVFDRLVSILPETMKVAFESSFLQGTNAILEAMKEGGYAADKWLVNTSRALGATFIPGTLGRVSNHFGDGYLKDVYNTDLKQWIKNTYAANNFMGEDLPNKIDVWGRPIKRISGETPMGEFVYNMFDFTKSQTVQADPLGYNIYYLWKRTKNNDALPEVFPSTLTINGEQLKLTPKQKETIAILIGSERRRAASLYIQSNEWEEATDEQRIADLQTIYEEARKRGIEEFKKIEEYVTLEKKGKREKSEYYKRKSSIRKLIDKQD